MIRIRDLILILVTAVGVVSGVYFPNQAGIFTPAILYFLMGLMFLAFLNIDFTLLIRMKREDLLEIFVLMVFKLFLLPIICWLAALWLLPSYALPVLLLSGVSCGVTAPFFAGLLGANVNRTVQLVIISTLALPFTLPALVRWLMHAQVDVAFSQMAQLLLTFIFIPLGAALIVRKIIPAAIPLFGRVGFPLSVTIFFLLFLGIFSRFSDFLRTQHGELLIALAVASGICMTHGLLPVVLKFFSHGKVDGLAGAVSMVYLNNILTIVFAAQFFGPKAPLLAAVYIAPVFLALIPLRWWSEIEVSHA